MPATEIVVQIGSISFNSSLSSGSDFYLLRNTRELLSTLSTRKTDKDRQGGHGTEDSLSFFGPRILPFEGIINASSQAQRVLMERNLKSAVNLVASQSYAGNDGYVLILITDEDGIEKQIYAKILDPPKFSLLEEAMPEMGRFEFVMYAKEPVLYAQSVTVEVGLGSYPTTTSKIIDDDLPRIIDDELPTIIDETGNQLSVSNDGSFGSPPVITVTGPTVNPRITNGRTGHSMNLTAGGGLTINADESLTINVAAQTIIKTDNVGVQSDVSGKLSTDSQWIFIEPGTNALTLLDDTPDVTIDQLQVEFRSAWM